MKNTTNQPITELEAWWLDEPEECVPETQTELPPNTTDEPKICPCGCGGEVKEGKTWATPGCYSRCKGPRPKKIKVCHCGCGREVTEGQKWATPDCYRQYQQRLHPNSEEPEYIGLCSCGCGGLVKKGNLWAAGGCASHYAKTQIGRAHV